MTATLQSAELALHWQQLPPLPDPIGFAGPFAGTSGGALIVAGGANFPDKMPWEGGRKVWYDTVYILDRTNGAWRGGFKLPRPLGYGVSVTTTDGVICIGGSDEKQHVRDVFLLSWKQGELKCNPLPPLPQPLANSCGAVVGNTVYVAGGTATPDATNALKSFWALDLGKREVNWRELSPWPGPPRMLAVAASVGGSFYLTGGTDLAPDSKGQPVRTYLKDAYRFTPGVGWQRIADMPNPVVAAPTPAPVCNGSGFLVIGGDDGSLVNFEPKSKHPGFPKRVLSYDTKLEKWSVLGDAPVSRATLPTAEWSGLTVMPSGEAKPGVRSPEVRAVRPSVK
ncbi:MAG TPA: galactose oxidase [Verrucomicrobiae bacterium]|nr:galactose oxidase [Verrucomicrobiae bacterium]